MGGVDRVFDAPREAVVAEGTMASHPVMGPSKPDPGGVRTLRIALAHAFDKPVNEQDYLDAGFQECTTPAGQRICRCGYYEYLWPDATTDAPV